MCLHEDVFPSWDSNLGSLVLMGAFLIHLATQAQAISCTPLSPGSVFCCKVGPLVSLLDNRMGVRSTRVRTIICTPWISPLRDLNPRPTRGPSQKPLLLVFIGMYCCPHTDMYGLHPGPTPHSVSTSLGLVRTLIHSLRWGSMANKHPNVLVPQ